jgi:transcriptional regulator with XRE-family HTH domain
MHVDLKSHQLRHILATCCLSQAELARILQVSKPHPSRLLIGTRRPSPRLRAAMLATLGADFADLFRIATSRKS